MGKRKKVEEAKNTTEQQGPITSPHEEPSFSSPVWRKKLNLRQKLFLMTTQLQTLTKDSKDKSDRLYLSQKALVSAVQQKLNEFGLYHEMRPENVTVVSEERMISRSTGSGFERIRVPCATLTVTHVLIDLDHDDTAEMKVEHWGAYAEDREGDGALQKAYSYAERSFFRHYFKINALDPKSVEDEVDEALSKKPAGWLDSTERVTPSSETEPAQPVESFPRLSSEELQTLTLEEEGVTGAWIRVNLMQKYGKDPDGTSQEIVAKHREAHGSGCRCVEDLLAKRNSNLPKGSRTATAADIERISKNNKDKKLGVPPVHPQVAASDLEKGLPPAFNS